MNDNTKMTEDGNVSVPVDKYIYLLETALGLTYSKSVRDVFTKKLMEIGKQIDFIPMLRDTKMLIEWAELTEAQWIDNNEVQEKSYE